MVTKPDTANLLDLCDCENCPLKGSTRVPGQGTSESTQYDLLFVGIAPAREEVARVSPFVGWSGTLLKGVLAKLGILDFFLTNTLLCELLEGLTAAEERTAIACCSKRLSAEVDKAKPKLVVALGNMPLEVFTGFDYKIRSVTGRILPGIKYPVLPVLHPASLRRRPDEFLEFVNGLRSGPKYLAGTYVQAVIPTYTLIDENNLWELCERLEREPLVAVDLETTGRGFFPYGREPDKIRCIALAFDSHSAYIVPGVSSPYFATHPDYTTDKRLIKAINRAKIIFHNGPFDIGFLKQSGYDPKIYFDTFLAHYLMDEREYTHGLKPLAHKYLGAPDWEEDLQEFLPNKHSSYDLIPDDKLYGYASHDVVYTYQLAEESGFRRSMQGQGIFFDLLMPAANMFADLRHRGMRIDVGYLMGLDGVLESDLNKAIGELRLLASYPVNPFSPQEVAILLYDRLKLPISRRYGRSTSKQALKQFEGMPVVDSVLECRAIGKLKSTYVVGTANFVDGDFRIHHATKLHGAVTGRISTEDPSVMNVTKRGGIKKLFLPEEGHLILDMDQKQMEFRCYAVITDDKHMKELFSQNVDIHMEVAKELAGRRGIEWESLSTQQQEDLRQRCKSGDFGRLYGRGLDSFIRGYGLTKEEAVNFVAVIDGVFPSIVQYNKKVKEQIHSVGYLESFFGRKRRFGLILDENKHEYYRQGANFLVQSMASDINLYCMLHLYELRKKLGATPLFPVHDSIVSDIESVEAIPDIVKELQEYSRELVNGEMQFKMDTYVGPSWGETKKWNRLVLE